jgi:hypothetical protein
MIALFEQHREGGGAHGDTDFGVEVALDRERALAQRGICGVERSLGKAPFERIEDRRGSRDYGAVETQTGVALCPRAVSSPARGDR